MKRRSRKSFLTNLKIDQLTAEIARRHDLLLQARSEFEAALSNIDAELATFDGFGTGGGSPRRRGPGRPRGTGAPTAHRRGPDGTRPGRGGNERRC